MDPVGVVLEAEGVVGVKWINPEAIILPINDLIKNLDRLKILHSSLEKSQINLRPVACIRGRKIIIKVNLKIFKIKNQEIHRAQTEKTGVQTWKNPIRGSQKDTPTLDRELETAIINDIRVRGQRPTRQPLNKNITEARNTSTVQTPPGQAHKATL